MFGTEGRGMHLCDSLMQQRFKRIVFHRRRMAQAIHSADNDKQRIFRWQDVARERNNGHCLGKHLCGQSCQVSNTKSLGTTSKNLLRAPAQAVKSGKLHANFKINFYKKQLENLLCIITHCYML